MTVREAAKAVLLEIDVLRKSGIDVPPSLVIRGEALRTALAANEAVEVPREPTYEMVQAGAKVVKDNLPYHTGTRAIYIAMLAAADGARGEG